MILAFDTYYVDNTAKTVCVSFKDWSDDQPSHIYNETITGIAAYEPGSFYKRELPCILSLLKQIELQEVSHILVDSFVLLDDHDKLGLGGYLYQALDATIPIIGVAKSGFHNNTKNTLELIRGNSKKPLYISAMGIPLQEAYLNIKKMHGNYRMPTLLQILDTKTREN